MSRDIKDMKDDSIEEPIITEFREETWGKNVEGAHVTDG